MIKIKTFCGVENGYVSPRAKVVTLAVAHSVLLATSGGEGTPDGPFKPVEDDEDY